MEVTKVMTSAEVAEKRAFYDDEWRSESHARFIEAARTDIPALCDSHDALERENERLKSDRERKWEVESLLASAVDFLNSWARDIAVPEAPRIEAAKGVVDQIWRETNRKHLIDWQRISDLTAQLAERDKAIAAAPHEMLCQTQPCSGRPGAPCDCWKSRVLTPLQPPVASTGAVTIFSPEIWPRCGNCGGVAVTNASGDITRTCIRCGGIVRRATFQAEPNSHPRDGGPQQIAWDATDPQVKP